MTSVLISATELAELMNQKSSELVIADTRHDLMAPDWGRQAFTQAHIPGAVFASIDDDLSAKPTGDNGRHPLPSVASAEQTFGRLGISNQSLVVVYDQGSGMFAARMWWMLRWLGHNQVKVLDGGLAQWQKLGLPLETGVAPLRAHANFVANEQKHLLCDANETLQACIDHTHLIIDARAPERYRGDVEPMDRVAGHIPGAINRPFTQNLENGLFKPAAQLRQEFLTLLNGVAPAMVIHQCGSGVSAANNLLAMAQAGLDGGSLYAGSWSEWCSDPTRPIAKGSK